MIHIESTSLKSSLLKKWSFPLRIFSLNVTKSTVSRGFGHIYWRNPKWKTSFSEQCFSLEQIYVHKILSKGINLSSSYNFIQKETAGVFLRSFPVNLAKISTTPFLQNTFGRQLFNDKKKVTCSKQKIRCTMSNTLIFFKLGWIS